MANNLYQRMWDERGYGQRYRRIHACQITRIESPFPGESFAQVRARLERALENRKLSALSRVWRRMVQMEQNT